MSGKLLKYSSNFISGWGSSTGSPHYFFKNHPDPSALVSSLFHSASLYISSFVLFPLHLCRCGPLLSKINIKVIIITIIYMFQYLHSHWLFTMLYQLWQWQIADPLIFSQSECSLQYDGLRHSLISSSQLDPVHPGCPVHDIQPMTLSHSWCSHWQILLQFRPHRPTGQSNTTATTR